MMRGPGSGRKGLEPTALEEVQAPNRAADERSEARPRVRAAPVAPLFGCSAPASPVARATSPGLAPGVAWLWPEACGAELDSSRPAAAFSGLAHIRPRRRAAGRGRSREGKETEAGSPAGGAPGPGGGRGVGKVPGRRELPGGGRRGYPRRDRAGGETKGFGGKNKKGRLRQEGKGELGRED